MFQEMMPMSQGGGGVKYASGTDTCVALGNYKKITCRDSNGNTFKPKTVIMYHNDGSYQYFGVYAEDLDSTHCWKNQAGANQNAFLPFPSTSSAGWFCHIKDVVSDGFEIWGYSAYSFNWIAYG